MPEAKVKGESAEMTGKKLPMPLSGNVPINVTLAKIGDRLFIDPSFEEEEVLDCRLSVAFMQKGDDVNALMICAMQKGEAGYLTAEEVVRAVELAKLKSQELRSLVSSKVNING